MGKGFDNSAPCTALRSVSDVGHPDTTDAAIWIKVNGETQQESTLDLHIWNTAETIAWVLAQGDDIVPIPGTQRRNYLEENVRAASLGLSDDIIERLNNAFLPGSVSGNRYQGGQMERLSR